MLIGGQCVCASNFIVEEYKGVCNLILAGAVLLALVVSVLSPVLPHELKKDQKEYHLAGLIFFALVYFLLFLFYRSKYSYQPEESQNDNTLQNNLRNTLQNILSANKVLSVVSFLSAIPSTILYMTDAVNFASSLWVS